MRVLSFCDATHEQLNLKLCFSPLLSLILRTLCMSKVPKSNW